MQYFSINEEHGIFSTVLPVFENQRWLDIIGSSGYVWIFNPTIDLNGKLDAILAAQFPGCHDGGIKYSVQQLEMSISISSTDFLRLAVSHFNQGIDLVHSAKHQPGGLRLSVIQKSKLATVMKQNEISMTLHRPAGGEPSLLKSSDKGILQSVIGRLSE